MVFIRPWTKIVKRIFHLGDDEEIIAILQYIPGKNYTLSGTASDQNFAGPFMPADIATMILNFSAIYDRGC